MDEVTRILQEAKRGEPAAADRLLATVYEDLRRLAAVHMARERRGGTLQPTALVHEAYVRLVSRSSAGGSGPGSWENRRHFFAAASEAMRRILIERARRKSRKRHGGDIRHVPLPEHELPGVADCDSERLLMLNLALERFQTQDAAKAELVKLRYFGGLPIEQAAEILGISRATACRRWAYAKAWLYAEMDAMDGR